MERSRRGKLHAAKAGSANVLSGAPYGFRYLTKFEGGGSARIEVVPEQAEVVKQVFEWIGRDRLSIGEVCRRLAVQGIPSAKGRATWERTQVWGMLRNPAYKGTAAFGKTRIGPMRKRLNPGRGHAEQPRRAHSTYDVPTEEWLLVPVPAIVSTELFETAQEQLKENREQARVRRRGASYLLQGLVKCKECGYSFYGKPVSITSAKGKRRDYAYYRCIGTDAFRFGGSRICQNKQIRTDKLDEVVWAAVQDVLKHPHRLETEYRRRLKGSKQTEEGILDQLHGQMAKVQRGIARLIDSYADGLLEKSEFEPRIRGQKQRLAALEVREKQVKDETQLQRELQSILEQLEGFAERIRDGLDTADWHTRRELIRTLVKRVEIDQEEVNIVFRIGSLPPTGGSGGKVLQHCKGRH
jgi:site-specific DNA recombinase